MTEAAIAAGVLNRMLDLGRPEHVRIAQPRIRVGISAFKPPVCATRRVTTKRHVRPVANAGVVRDPETLDR